MTAADMTPGRYAELTPDAPAIIMGSSRDIVTYAQLEERSVRFARALRSRGVGVGDHIAILMENNRPFLEITWAAQRSGLYLHGDQQPPARRRGAVHPRRLRRRRPCGLPRPWPRSSAGLDLSRIADPRSRRRGDLRGFERYEDMLAGVPPIPCADECEGREMLYSSGTTGRPKGVRKHACRPPPLGDPRLGAGPDRAGPVTGDVGPGSVYLSPAPLYHVAPLVILHVDATGSAATVVVMERFDPAQCLELIERHRVTHAQFVPTMFVRMLHLPEERQPLRPVQSELRGPCRGAVPGRR